MNSVKGRVGRNLVTHGRDECLEMDLVIIVREIAGIAVFRLRRSIEIGNLKAALQLFLIIMQYFKTSRITLLLFVNVFLLSAVSFRAPGRWLTLFDGKKVEGWHSYNQQRVVGWFVENGTLTTDGTGGGLEGEGGKKQIP